MDDKNPCALAVRADGCFLYGLDLSVKNSACKIMIKAASINEGVFQGMYLALAHSLQLG